MNYRYYLLSVIIKDMTIFFVKVRKKEDKKNH